MRYVILLAGVFTFFLTSAVHANTPHKQISGMTEPQRRQIMAFMLTKSSEECSKVTRTFYQGSDDQGNAFWNAACSEGEAYSILLQNDEKGSIRILNCRALKKLSAVPCFKKFKKQ